MICFYLKSRQNTLKCCTFLMDCDVLVNAARKNPSENEKFQEPLNQNFSDLLNPLEVTISSHFDIHLHTLSLQQVPLGQRRYSSHTSFISMVWTTLLDCTSLTLTMPHTIRTVPEGRLQNSVGKGPQPVNRVRNCLKYSYQGSPLKTRDGHRKTLGLIWPKAKHSDTQTSTRRTSISWRNSWQ